MPEIVTNDGARIHYVERGEGRPLLFAGGWCMSTAFFRKQLAGLSDTYRVIAMDMRAYGESEKVSHGHRMARHARDIHDVVLALDLEDVTGVGWSSGANAFLSHYELFRDERVTRLVHVDQTPYCLNRAGWELGFGTEEDAVAFLRGFRDDQRAAAHGLVDAMFFAPVSDDERAWMVEEMLKTPAPQALQFEWDHVNADWRDMVPTVGIPVLVATGRESRIFPWRSGQWLAERLPHGRQVVFERSGHLPFYEESDAFNDEVRAFVG